MHPTKNKLTNKIKVSLPEQASSNYAVSVGPRLPLKGSFKMFVYSIDSFLISSHLVTTCSSHP